MQKLKLAAVVLAGLFVLIPPAQATIATLTVQQSSKSGITPTRTNSGLSSSNTYRFRNDGRTFLMFQKTGAGSCTVTLTAVASPAGLTISNPTLTVAATTGDIIAGPFPARIFNDSNQDMTFTLSDTVGLSIAVVRF